MTSQGNAEVSTPGACHLGKTALGAGSVVHGLAVQTYDSSSDPTEPTNVIVRLAWRRPPYNSSLGGLEVGDPQSKLAGKVSHIQ